MDREDKDSKIPSPISLRNPVLTRSRRGQRPSARTLVRWQLFWRFGRFAAGSGQRYFPRPRVPPQSRSRRRLVIQIGERIEPASSSRGEGEGLCCLEMDRVSKRVRNPNSCWNRERTAFESV